MRWPHFLFIQAFAGHQIGLIDTAEVSAYAYSCVAVSDGECTPQPARDHTICTLLAEVGERAFGARETGSSRKDTLSAVRRELANQAVLNPAAQVIAAQEIVAAIYGEYYVKSAEQAHVKVYNACMSEWLL